MTKDERELEKWEDAFFSIQIRKSIKKSAKSTTRIQLLTREMQVKIGTIIADFFDESLEIQRIFTKYDQTVKKKSISNKQHKGSEMAAKERDVNLENSPEPNGLRKLNKREAMSRGFKEKNYSSSLERPGDYEKRGSNKSRRSPMDYAHMNPVLKKTSFLQSKLYSEENHRDSDDHEMQNEQTKFNSENRQEAFFRPDSVNLAPEEHPSIYEDASPKDNNYFREKMSSLNKKPRFALSLMPAPTDNEFNSARDKNNVNFFSQTSIRCKENKANEKDKITSHVKAVNTLKNGFMFLKYGKYGQPHEKLVYLSRNEQRLEWKDINKKSADCIDICQISDILEGRQNGNFKRFKTKDDQEILSFSIISPQRNLDFEADSLESKLKFLSSIKILINSCKVENNVPEGRSQTAFVEKNTINQRKTKSKDHKE